jgi:uncharacterized protein YhhL (DUF1145 family)
MNPSTVVMLLGWFFLILNFVWPETKWGGRAIKIALSSFSLGVFVAGAIYTFMN